MSAHLQFFHVGLGDFLITYFTRYLGFVIRTTKESGLDCPLTFLTISHDGTPWCVMTTVYTEAGAIFASSMDANVTCDHDYQVS